jgi:hydrogen cyanide synthase HcnB
LSEVLGAPFTKEGIQDRAAKKRFEADAMAVGYGLLSRTAVPRLLDTRMHYDALVGDYIPSRSQDLETSVPGVFAVGDGARVSGKLVAREEGVLAGLAAARRLGGISDSDFSQRSAPLRDRLRRLYRFRKAVDELHRLPEGLFDIPADNTIVCRCEEVTAGEIRRAAREGTLDLNDIKRRGRAGHGWCQGRTCGPAIVEMLARENRLSREEIFRMTPRPPSKPIPLSMLLEE